MRRKHRGSLAISIVIILALTPFLTSSIIHILNLESTTRADSLQILEEYNSDSFSNLLVIDTLDKLTNVYVTYPTSILYDTVFVYEQALNYIPNQDYNGNLYQRISTIGNTNILSTIDKNQTADISLSDFECNYSNGKNILLFEDEDKLYLDPFEITIIMDNSKNLYKFIISNLYLNITHEENEFTINCMYDEILIERVKL